MEIDERKHYLYIPKTLSNYEYLDKAYNIEDINYLKDLIIEISKKYWRDPLTYENLDNYENLVGIISGASLWSGSNGTDNRWEVTEYVTELLRLKILNSKIVME